MKWREKKERKNNENIPVHIGAAHFTSRFDLDGTALRKQYRMAVFYQRVSAIIYILYT